MTSHCQSPAENAPSGAAAVVCYCLPLFVSLLGPALLFIWLLCINELPGPLWLLLFWRAHQSKFFAGVANHALLVSGLSLGVRDCTRARVCVCVILIVPACGSYLITDIFCFSIWVQEALLVGCCQATHPFWQQLLLWLSVEAAASEVKRFPASQPATPWRPLSEPPVLPSIPSQTGVNKSKLFVMNFSGRLSVSTLAN